MDEYFKGLFFGMFMMFCFACIVVGPFLQTEEETEKIAKYDELNIAYITLETEYNQLLKDKEEDNKYIEWLQNRIYEYEGDVSYEIQ